jgi:hypothetical protein
VIRVDVVAWSMEFLRAPDKKLNFFGSEGRALQKVVVYLAVFATQQYILKIANPFLLFSSNWNPEQK